MALCGVGGVHAAVNLPALKIDKTQTTVSGLSSGGFMAAQFAVAYSATVAGAGIIAGGIGLLLVVQIGLYVEGSAGMWPLAILLTLFFVAFNVLEATQPSWISKIAPPHAKGTALGIYNTLQSLGLFLGGALGGTLGMRMFHHKTKHKEFRFGFPALLCLQCAAVVYLILIWKQVI